MSLNAAGFDLIPSNSDEEAETEQKAIGVQLAKRVDGLLVAPRVVRGHREPAHDRRRRPPPRVVRPAPPPSSEVDTVDRRQPPSAAEQLTGLLTAAGHRRIAFISTIRAPCTHYRRGDILGSSSVADRVQGFVEALELGRASAHPRRSCT